MAPPGDKNPKGPKGSDPKPTKSDKAGDEGKQGTLTITSDDKDKEQKIPPSDPNEEEKDPPPGDSESSEHQDSLSEITSSTSKPSLKCTQDQAGHHKKSFESLLYKLLQRLLEFRNKDPVPVVLLALEDCGTHAVVDFISLTDKEIDSLEFPTGWQYRLLGPSHGKAIRISQGLIRDNTDGDGKPLPNILHLLTADCIKRHGACQAKEQHEKQEISKVASTDTKTLLAMELKKWRAVKQDPSSCSVLRDDYECFTWRQPFVSRIMTQHLATLLQPNYTVPVDPAERSMHDEKAICLWSMLEHVLQSPKGVEATNQFKPEGYTIPTSRPAIQCFHFFEKMSMDGETRSRAIQTQSKILHKIKLSDKKFPSRAAFLASHRTQFTEWMRLNESKLDIDACRSSFFDAIDSDTEFSRIVIQLKFSNKWADEQGMTPSAAAAAFFDELRVQAELLDSIDLNKHTKPSRQANAHITTATPDESSQASVEDQDDEELSDSPPHVQEELLLFQTVRRNFDPKLTIHPDHYRAMPCDFKKMLRGNDDLQKKTVRFVDTIQDNPNPPPTSQATGPTGGSAISSVTNPSPHATVPAALPSVTPSTQHGHQLPPTDPRQAYCHAFPAAFPAYPFPVHHQAFSHQFYPPACPTFSHDSSSIEPPDASLPCIKSHWRPLVKLTRSMKASCCWAFTHGRTSQASTAVISRHHRRELTASWQTHPRCPRTKLFSCTTWFWTQKQLTVKIGTTRNAVQKSCAGNTRGASGASNAKTSLNVLPTQPLVALPLVLHTGQNPLPQLLRKNAMHGSANGIERRLPCPQRRHVSSEMETRVPRGTQSAKDGTSCITQVRSGWCTWFVRPWTVQTAKWSLLDGPSLCLWQWHGENVHWCHHGNPQCPWGVLAAWRHAGGKSSSAPHIWWAAWRTCWFSPRRFQLVISMSNSTHGCLRTLMPVIPPCWLCRTLSASRMSVVLKMLLLIKVPTDLQVVPIASSLANPRMVGKSTSQVLTTTRHAMHQLQLSEHLHIQTRVQSSASSTKLHMLGDTNPFCLPFRWKHMGWKWMKSIPTLVGCVESCPHLMDLSSHCRIMTRCRTWRSDRTRTMSLTLFHMSSWHPMSHGIPAVLMPNASLTQTNSHHIFAISSLIRTAISPVNVLAVKRNKSCPILMTVTFLRTPFRMSRMYLRLCQPLIFGSTTPSAAMGSASHGASVSHSPRSPVQWRPPPSWSQRWPLNSGVNVRRISTISNISLCGCLPTSFNGHSLIPHKWVLCRRLPMVTCSSAGTPRTLLSTSSTSMTISSWTKFTLTLPLWMRGTPRRNSSLVNDHTWSTLNPFPAPRVFSVPFNPSSKNGELLTVSFVITQATTPAGNCPTVSNHFGLDSGRVKHIINIKTSSNVAVRPSSVPSTASWTALVLPLNFGSSACVTSLMSSTASPTHPRISANPFSWQLDVLLTSALSSSSLGWNRCVVRWMILLSPPTLQRLSVIGLGLPNMLVTPWPLVCGARPLTRSLTVPFFNPLFSLVSTDLFRTVLAAIGSVITFHPPALPPLIASPLRIVGRFFQDVHLILSGVIKTPTKCLIPPTVGSNVISVIQHPVTTRSKSHRSVLEMWSFTGWTDSPRRVRTASLSGSKERRTLSSRECPSHTDMMTARKKEPPFSDAEKTDWRDRMPATLLSLNVTRVKQKMQCHATTSWIVSTEINLQMMVPCGNSDGWSVTKDHWPHQIDIGKVHHAIWKSSGRMGRCHANHWRQWKMTIPSRQQSAPWRTMCWISQDGAVSNDAPSGRRSWVSLQTRCDCGPFARRLDVNTDFVCHEIGTKQSALMKKTETRDGTKPAMRRWTNLTNTQPSSTKESSTSRESQRDVRRSPHISSLMSNMMEDTRHEWWLVDIWPMHPSKAFTQELSPWGDCECMCPCRTQWTCTMCHQHRQRAPWG